MKSYLTMIAAALMATACATTDYDRYDTWDLDNDGRVSMIEFNEGFDRAGFDMDLDHDGFYEEHEIATGVFDWYDLDRDGIWDRNEFIAANTAFGNTFGTYATFDLDRNARIDDREWSDGFATTGLYDRWDVNRGGTLDDMEVRTGMFEWADLDNDGYLDDTEWDEWNTLG